MASFDFLPSSFRLASRSVGARTSTNSSSSYSSSRVTKDTLQAYLKHDMKAKSASRERLIKLAEKRYCGDLLNFLGAIFDYEAEAEQWGTDGPSFSLRFEAHRIITAFVEHDAPFEVTLSAPVRDTLLARKRDFIETDITLFDSAKSEILHSILYSSDLLKLLYG